MSTIGCFKCSEIQEVGSCPTRSERLGRPEKERDFSIFSGAESSDWQKDTKKYGIAQTYESEAMCSVVVASKSRQVLHLNTNIYTIFVVRLWQNIPPGSGGSEHLQ